jgi:hypothetical protein
MTLGATACKAPWGASALAREVRLRDYLILLWIASVDMEQPCGVKWVASYLP